MNNLNLYANATINGGEYDNIKIFGSTTVNGDLKAKTMKVFGSSTFNAPCDMNVVEIFGSTTFYNTFKAHELNIKGSCLFEEDVTIDLLKIFGSVTFNKKCSKSDTVRIYGSVTGSVIEANKIVIEGAIHCDELNSDDIEIKTNNECHIKEMVGSKIVVKGKKYLFQKQRGMVYLDTIEGDEIELECVEAKVVRGSKIKIGPNCKIERIEYSENLSVSNESTVNEQEKMS